MFKTAFVLVLLSLFSVAHASPRELFVQVSSVPTGAEAYKTQAWFNKACAQNPKLDSLVLQNVADAQGNLYAAQLDTISSYFKCFSNIFVGTTEPLWDGPGSPYVEGIVDPNFRWSQIYLSRAIADKFIARYPDLYFNWYITYEANLNFFVGDDVRTDTKVGTPITGNSVKEAYKAYLAQLSGDLYAKKPRAVLWSPTFWKPFLDMSAEERANLQVAIQDTIAASNRVNWLHFQDFMGQQSFVRCESTASCYPRVIYKIGCDNTKNYYSLLSDATANTQIVSLRVNMEMFITQYLPNDTYGLMPADKYELFEREACYSRNNLPIGASWEIRWWYWTYFGTWSTSWN